MLNIFFILRKKQNENGKKLISRVKWIALFALIYILILPLGGYREYRPNIIRGDTLLILYILTCVYTCLYSFLRVVRWVASSGI